LKAREPDTIAGIPLTPESGLILRCVRHYAGRDERRQIARQLQGCLDWDALVRLAEAHKVLPILHAVLKESHSCEVPESVLETMKRKHAANFAGNLMLSYELIRILEALESRGIRCLVFKGPTLAVAAYGSIAMRRFQDLDLLVRRNDFLKTKDLLREIGYQPALRLPEAYEEHFYLTRSEHHFVRNDGKATVDLHWGLSPPCFSFFQDLDRLWPRSLTVAIEGAKVSAPGMEDLLLFLCRHGAKHRWEGLSLISDVAMLIAAHRAMDWPGVLARAKRTNSTVMLALGLRLAVELVGAEVPENIGDWMRADRKGAVLAGKVIRSLFSSEERPTVDVADRLNLFHMRTMSKFTDGLHEIVLNLFTPTSIELSLIRLPGRLYFLYYPCRLLRLAVRSVLNKALRTPRRQTPDRTGARRTSGSDKP